MLALLVKDLSRDKKILKTLSLSSCFVQAQVEYDVMKLSDGLLYMRNKHGYTGGEYIRTGGVSTT